MASTANARPERRTHGPKGRCRPPCGEFGGLLDSEDQLRYYASVLAHDARLLAPRVAQTEADSVMAVLSTCTASHIDDIECD